MITGLLSDLHFEDKVLEDYRWNLFPQVHTIIEKYGIKQLYILGDLTTAVDKHSGRFVNKIVRGLCSWTEVVDQVVILFGNHDGISPEHAYWNFLNKIPKLEFIREPTTIIYRSDESAHVFLPHSRQPLEDWKDVDITDKLVFAHVTVNKCLAESGVRMDSEIEAGFFKEALMTFAGDVHKPQMMGEKFAYIGSPYNTRFGDSYDGGMVILDPTLEIKRESKAIWFRVPLQFPRKLSMECTNAYQVQAFLADFEKDHTIPAQVKIKLKVDQNNIDAWQRIKSEIEEVVRGRGHTYIDTEVEQTWKVPLSTENRIVDEETELSADDYTSFCQSQGITEDLTTAGRNIMQEKREVLK
jgi:hypothetical protein